MAYVIKDKHSGSFMHVGYQEEIEDSDGNFYNSYWYMYDDDISYNQYDCYIEAENDLQYACWDGAYTESDYEIVEV